MRKLAILWLLLSLTLPGHRLAAQGSESFRVIVHPSHPASEMPQIEVSRLFLKKTTRWSHGAKVLPVDQLPRSAVRAAFSEEVLRKDVDSVKSYWQAQLFSGTATPPPELSSDAEVVAFVAGNAGAIGYVSAGTAVEGVKVLKLND